jgi:hypothetical protein
VSSSKCCKGWTLWYSVTVIVSGSNKSNCQSNTRLRSLTRDNITQACAWGTGVKNERLNPQYSLYRQRFDPSPFQIQVGSVTAWVNLLKDVPWGPKPRMTMLARTRPEIVQGVHKVQMPLPGRCVLNHSATNVAPTQKDQPLLLSKRRPHFQTHKRSWNEQKCGPESRRGPETKKKYSDEASSNLPDPTQRH